MEIGGVEIGMMEAGIIIAGVFCTCLSLEWKFGNRTDYGIYFFIAFIRKKINGTK